MWTQGFLPIEGQIFALLQVRPDEAKYAVIGTERIFDGVMALILRSRHPEIGAAGNGHYDGLSPAKREVRMRITRTRAMRAMA